jgi:anti-sigma-K factor RskA
LLRFGGATSNETAASAHGLDYPVVGWSRRNERNFMMNHTNGWMGGWSGGGMWIWAVIGVAVVVLLVVMIGKLSKK